MGAQQILDAIMDEARRDCEQIAADAREAVSTKRTSVLAEAQSRADAITAAGQKNAAEAERRRMLTAGIEARKNSLSARRALLERAFSLALDKLTALEGNDYVKFVSALAANAAQTGTESVLVPASARERFEKPYAGGKTALEAMNDALKKAGKPAKLTLSAENGGFKGGFRLVGELADVDCSFESLVAAWRDENETEASKRLFGSEG